MTAPTLILNRHVHGVFFDDDRCLLPLDAIAPYLVTHPWGGTDGLDPGQFPNTAILDLNDEAHLEILCDWIIEEYDIRHIIALHEKTILPAAALRSRHGLDGLDMDTATLFRDKVRMKEAVAAAGIPVPEFWPLDSRADLTRHLDWTTGPKVLKSRFGVGAEGTRVVGSLAEAEAWWDAIQPTPGRYEIEEFVSGQMFHCDAVVEHGRVTFAPVSRYVAHPGDFGPGRMAGSVDIGSDPLADRIRDVNTRVVEALGLRGAVTHLEVFHTPDDRIVFLEIAARPGGGGIDRYLQRGHGVHIFEAAMRVEIGLPALPRHLSAADSATLGVVGFYPGLRDGGIEPSEFAGYGVVEHVDSPSRAFRPRHCTDYRHRYVLTAPSVDAFLDNADGLRRAYWA